MIFHTNFPKHQTQVIRAILNNHIFQPNVSYFIHMYDNPWKTCFDKQLFGIPYKYMKPNWWSVKMYTSQTNASFNTNVWCETNKTWEQLYDLSCTKNTQTNVEYFIQTIIHMPYNCIEFLYNISQTNKDSLHIHNFPKDYTKLPYQCKNFNDFSWNYDNLV